MRPHPSRLARSDAWVALGAGGFALVLYLRTLAPGLLPDDSGELQVLSCLLGHTHPTGYPVYLLVGKIFTCVP